MAQAIQALARTPTVLTPSGFRRGHRWVHSFIPVKNEPGRLLMIDKLRLHVDYAYQRDKIDLARVERYAANWSWVSCGVLLVTARGNNGDYWIIDGQHRRAAAMKIRGIKQLPCLAFQLDEVRDEAIGFLAANTERKPPTLAEQFKAMIIANDPLALHIQELAETAGRKVSAPADAKNISCVAQLLTAAQLDRDALDRVWPVIVRLCQGRPIMARTVRALVALERWMPQGQTLNSPRWADRIVHVGYDTVHQSMKQMVHLENSSGARVLAEGVQRAINRNLRDPLDINWARRLT